MRFTAIPRMSAALRFWVSRAGLEAKSPRRPTTKLLRVTMEEWLCPKGNFIGLNRVYTRDER